MLLLVLILVVLAFGLLVFAPQAGSVLAAWAAVALSAIAGLVLLVDWMQRRSAMRAGAASLEAAGHRPPNRDLEYQQDPEPATEVLPVIPPAGPGPQPGQPAQVEGPTALTPRADAGAPEGAAENVADAGVDSRFDGLDDSQQTVLMPAVEPSGSSARPSSAPDGTAPSSGPSSPSVTKDGSTAAADDPSEGDRVAEPAQADAGATVLVDTRKRPATEAPTTTVDRSAVPAADAPATKAEPAVTEAPAPAAAAEQTRAGDSQLSGSDLFGAGEQRAAQEPAAAQQPAEAAPEEAATLGEPPVEQSEPAAAALVATLEDEVVVIDEQPRYHVVGCKGLTAHEPIPIPAREAVELGFTPCGWCSPDRTLAERHPAATR
ncbi:hypothetical protein ACQEVB_21380 [Pseudonocardia sp. CA-107938]|uniref:hypothetical protein n=1 Tax=Pseudonocardia sp. CA-107938 TaxID=3240021 RepID=UPI003D8DFE10